MTNETINIETEDLTEGISDLFFLALADGLVDIDLKA
jgi:hypothetical protein